jgi:virginiamycin B lyase
LLSTPGGYPVSLVFDSNGKVWFTEIFGKKLGVLDPSKAQNNTTKGISELNLLKYINFDTTGPISNSFKFLHNNTTKNDTNIDNNSNILWFSTVNFPIGGQLVKYNIAKKNLTVYDLSDTHTIPLSVAEDEKGRLWTNDHASSLFLMLDPSTGYTKQYATSFPLTVNTTTLPYYNEYKDGKIWFNEHYGNTISFFDPKNSTLVEYHIPTEDTFWGNASNPLRFVFDNNGSIWFTEWTENKIGVVHKDKMNSLPISLSTSKNKMDIDKSTGKGDTVDIYLYKNSSKLQNNNSSLSNSQGNNKSSNITMYATSSLSKLGVLSNLTSSFSTDKFSIPAFDNNTLISPSSPFNTPYKTTLKIDPTKSLVPGNYTLTISARYNKDITVSKIIDLDIH